jgi:hypothetical protein
MPTTPAETLMETQRALITQAQDLTMKNVQSFSRLFELQRDAAQRLFNTGADRAPAATKPKAATATGSPAAGPMDMLRMMQGGAEYGTRMTQMFWENQAQMMRLMQANMSQMTALLGALTAAGTQASAFMRMANNTMGTASRA